jgi:hypothetical protein
MTPDSFLVPRNASEYDKGGAFGLATTLRQIDGGLSAGQIQETQDAAKQTLLAAARSDGEREFCRGYAAAADRTIAALRDIQRAERQGGGTAPATKSSTRPADMTRANQAQTRDPRPSSQGPAIRTETDRGGFTGAGLFDREEIARYSLDDVRAAGRRPAPEHQQDREAGE